MKPDLTEKDPPGYGRERGAQKELCICLADEHPVSLPVQSSLGTLVPGSGFPLTPHFYSCSGKFSFLTQPARSWHPFIGLLFLLLSPHHLLLDFSPGIHLPGQTLAFCLTLDQC